VQFETKRKKEYGDEDENKYVSRLMRLAEQFMCFMAKAGIISKPKTLSSPIWAVLICSSFLRAPSISLSFLQNSRETEFVLEPCAHDNELHRDTRIPFSRRRAERGYSFHSFAYINIDIIKLENILDTFTMIMLAITAHLASPISLFLESHT
jgi:hypothetical protein